MNPFLFIGVCLFVLQSSFVFAEAVCGCFCCCCCFVLFWGGVGGGGVATTRKIMFFCCCCCCCCIFDRVLFLTTVSINFIDTVFAAHLVMYCMLSTKRQIPFISCGDKLRLGVTKWQDKAFSRLLVNIENYLPFKYRTAFLYASQKETIHNELHLSAGMPVSA